MHLVKYFLYSIRNQHLPQICAGCHRHRTPTYSGILSYMASIAYTRNYTNRPARRSRTEGMDRIGPKQSRIAQQRKNCLAFRLPDNHTNWPANLCDDDSLFRQMLAHYQAYSHALSFRATRKLHCKTPAAMPMSSRAPYLASVLRKHDMLRVGTFHRREMAVSSHTVRYPNLISYTMPGMSLRLVPTMP